VLAYFANYGASVNIGERSHARWVRLSVSPCVAAANKVILGGPY
jgi:hypothetical protein